MATNQGVTRRGFLAAASVVAAGTAIPASAAVPQLVTDALSRAYRAEVAHFSQKVAPELEAGDFDDHSKDPSEPIDLLSMRLEKDPELADEAAAHRCARIAAASPHLREALENTYLEGCEEWQVLPAIAGYCLAREILGGRSDS